MTVATISSETLCRVFLLPCPQLPPVTWNGFTFQIDVQYINERFNQSSEELEPLVKEYCEFITKTYLNHENKSSQLQPVGK